MMADPERVESVDAAVGRILAHCGARIVAAAPLALGKPNRVLNALYRRVKSEPARSLELFTALSLARPRPTGELERRFLEPFVARHFGADYPDLEYVADLRAGTLPGNVRVREFYLQSGAWLDNGPVQREYASLNYTHVAREVARRGVNVVMHLVARRGDRLSLSCNPDVTLELLDRIAAAGLPRPMIVAVVHPELAFLEHDEDIPLDFADLLLDEERPAHRLFALPASPVADAEFALGLHASTLVRDGGTLQIGIGALSDAIVQALLLRHGHNADYRAGLLGLGAPADSAIVAECGGLEPFLRGLYGASEMVMDGFMHLRRGGILRRQVYEDEILQRLMDAGRIADPLQPGDAETLLDAGFVPPRLDAAAVEMLCRFGLLPAAARLAGDVLELPDGARIGVDLAHAAHRGAFCGALAGRRIRGGRYLHGAFFLGTRALYRWLATLEGEDYEGLVMTRVAHINQLYGGNESLERAQRREARFFNTCMMHTLLGAAVSDALADGRVVSGVGGQYNFVAMGHALADGRSILLLRATRESVGKAASNIVWNYGHTTIPRHLRDVVVTEYGIADLRGASDEECVTRMLAISDARHLDALVAQARRAGKLSPGFAIPESWRANRPERIATALAPLKARGLLPRYPFGSDFTQDELVLVGALQKLKARTRTKLRGAWTMFRALGPGRPDGDELRLLQRLGLNAPAGMKERMLAKLVLSALRG